MPVAPTYPGVYVEERPPSARAISGVPTAVAAFIDWFPRGPMDQAVEVLSWADMERTFGGLHDRSEASYALEQFFRNGGARALVVRVGGATAPVTASVMLLTGAGGTNALRIDAADPGVWGNRLRVRIEPLPPGPPPLNDARFGLTVREYRIENGVEVIVREERHVNLSADPASPRWVEPIVNNASLLIRVADQVGTVPPGGSGTVGNPVTAPMPVTTGPARRRVTATLVGNSGSDTSDARIVELGTGPVTSLEDAAARLQSGLRTALPAASANTVPNRPEFSQAVVRVAAGNQLQIIAGTGTDPTAHFSFSTVAAAPADNNTATVLGLTAAAPPVGNVSAYQLGNTAAAFQAQGAATPGTDGSLPGAAQLIGSQSATPPTGMYALDLADIFNILCLPRVSLVAGARNAADNFPGVQVPAVIGAAIPYCAAKRAMLILDPPTDINTVPALRAWMTSNSSLRADNVALYFPRLMIGDRLDDFRLRSVAPSGTAAGLWARTDSSRGVWKAPAGTEVQVRGVNQLAYPLTDAENGLLNPIAINAFRNFDQYGMVSWGARTLHGEDTRGSQWRYIPVRRIAYYIEETLFRNTKWVIFEPNAEPLWSQIRLTVGAFMRDLFEKGAFAGRTRDEAYFVHCDASTTTPLDQERGVVNLVVGFAPLRPAEFLVITIQQISRLEA